MKFGEFFRGLTGKKEQPAVTKTETPAVVTPTGPTLHERRASAQKETDEQLRRIREGLATDKELMESGIAIQDGANLERVTRAFNVVRSIEDNRANGIGSDNVTYGGEAPPSIRRSAQTTNVTGETPITFNVPDEGRDVSEGPGMFRLEDINPDQKKAA